jgi:flagellar hook-length control protein FliK
MLTIRSTPATPATAVTAATAPPAAVGDSSTGAKESTPSFAELLAGSSHAASPQLGWLGASAQSSSVAPTGPGSPVTASATSATASDVSATATGHPAGSGRPQRPDDAAVLSALDLSTAAGMAGLLSQPPVVTPASAAPGVQGAGAALGASPVSAAVVATPIAGPLSAAAGSGTPGVPTIAAGSRFEATGFEPAAARAAAASSTVDAPAAGVSTGTTLTTPVTALAAAGAVPTTPNWPAAPIGIPSVLASTLAAMTAVTADSPAARAGAHQAGNDGRSAPEGGRSTSGAVGYPAATTGAATTGAATTGAAAAGATVLDPAAAAAALRNAQAEVSGAGADRGGGAASSNAESTPPTSTARRVAAAIDERGGLSATGMAGTQGTAGAAVADVQGSPTTPGVQADGTAAAQAFALPAAPAPSGPTSATGPSAAPPPATRAPVHHQIAEPLLALRVSGDGTHRLNIELHPADLGMVNVEVRLHDGAMSIAIASGSTATSETIRAALSDLHRELDVAGLSNVAVSVDTAGPQAHSGHAGPREQAGTARPTSGSGPRSATGPEPTTAPRSVRNRSADLAGVDRWL